MKNAVFWDVAPCRSCVNRRFRLQGVFDWWFSLQPPAHAGSTLTDFSTMKMEAIHSSETSVYTKYTRRYFPEDGILHSHRRENLKSYMRDQVSNERTYFLRTLWDLSGP
jgi:hypothetical protein